MLGRMDDVNTNPKDGPAAQYGDRASIAGSAAAQPLQRACALWWAPMQRKGMHCKSGSAHGSSGAQGPWASPPGILIAGSGLAPFWRFF